MRLIVLNRLYATCPGRLRAIKRAVANFQFDNILALCLQRLGKTQYRKCGFDGQRSCKFAELYCHVYSKWGRRADSMLGVFGVRNRKANLAIEEYMCGISNPNS